MRLAEKYSLDELQPVVDLVQLTKRPLTQWNEFLHMQEGRLAFGEVNESYAAISELVGRANPDSVHTDTPCLNIGGMDYNPLF